MRSFAESHAVFFETIARKGPEEAAAHAGCSAEGGWVIVPMAGKRFAVDPATNSVFLLSQEGEAPAGFLESVVAVTYLARADGTALSGEWVTEKQLDLGEFYFRSPHKLPTHKLSARFGKDPEGFVAAGIALGGIGVDLGDAGVEIPALPRVPLRFVLWQGDDEFPEADVRCLFDRTASVFLIQDGVLTLVNVIVKAMLEHA